jgi:YcxB-like protein
MSIVAEGKFTFADVWDGTLRACRRSILVLSVLGILTILFGIWLSEQREEGWAGERIFLAAGVFWLVYLWPFMIYRTRVTLKRTPNLQGTVRFEFSDEGCAVKTVHANSELKWGALSHWRETKRTLMLYQNPRVGSLVPKRFFQSAAEVETVRGYLAAKVKKKG